MALLWQNYVRYGYEYFDAYLQLRTQSGRMLLFGLDEQRGPESGVSFSG